MRKPFEKLVCDLIATQDRDVRLGTTLGDLALRHRCDPERIIDALDTIRMLQGRATYVRATYVGSGRETGKMPEAKESV